MNKEVIEGLLKETEDDIQYVEVISKDIVKSRTSVLDDLMKEVQEKIVVQDNPSDEIIEKYFLELSNAVYFVGAHCEYLGFYEDLSKNNAKLAYNKAYSNNQVVNASKNTKVTVADNQLAAENASINETLVSLIYARSYRIIKVKLDAANEMIRTLSKILSSHMQDRQLSKTTESSNYNMPF